MVSIKAFQCGAIEILKILVRPGVGPVDDGFRLKTCEALGQGRKLSDCAGWQAAKRFNESLLFGCDLHAWIDYRPAGRGKHPVRRGKSRLRGAAAGTASRRVDGAVAAGEGFEGAAVGGEVGGGGGAHLLEAVEEAEDEEDQGLVRCAYAQRDLVIS